MTEVEMAAACRVYELQTKRKPFEHLVRWVRSLVTDKAGDARRARLDRKADVERKGRKSL